MPAHLQFQHLPGTSSLPPGFSVGDRLDALGAANGGGGATGTHSGAAAFAAAYRSGYRPSSERQFRTMPGSAAQQEATATVVSSRRTSDLLWRRAAGPLGPLDLQRARASDAYEAVDSPV